MIRINLKPTASKQLINVFTIKIQIFFIYPSRHIRQLGYSYHSLILPIKSVLKLWEFIAALTFITDGAVRDFLQKCDNVLCGDIHIFADFVKLLVLVFLYFAVGLWQTSFDCFALFLNGVLLFEQPFPLIVTFSRLFCIGTLGLGWLFGCKCNWCVFTFIDFCSP